jgi:hydrogenase nickel incorporation protein HypB
MCGICGCSQPAKLNRLQPVTGRTHQHDHDHDHHHHDHETERLVKVEQDLLSKNNAYAEQNRSYFKQQIFLP